MSRYLIVGLIESGGIMRKILQLSFLLLLASAGMTSAKANDSFGFSIYFGAPSYYVDPPVIYGPPRVYYSPPPVIYYEAPQEYYGRYRYFGHHDGPRYHHEHRNNRGRHGRHHRDHDDDDDD